MIQPFEMKKTRPMELHEGVVSTTGSYARKVNAYEIRAVVGGPA
jgi:hypothetical protein